MSQPLALRTKAEALASPMPALLASAEHLAATVILGDHGRRRAGMGDTFWQYRQAQPYDTARSIDWRRSARSDTAFVQDKEWQIAQSIGLWVDNAASMQFASSEHVSSKSDRARLLGLAISILLARGGERIGLAGQKLPPRGGEAQLAKIATLLTDDGTSEYGSPSADGIPTHARAIFISDFFGDFSAVKNALFECADKGIRGVLMQVLDPQELSFPFSGRTVFESMGGSVLHETQKADALRDRYLARLAERKDQLTNLAKMTGWQYRSHTTDTKAAVPLLWMYQTLESLT